jgi:FkbM family methyltransferase
MANLIRHYVRHAYNCLALRSAGFSHLRPTISLQKTWHGTTYGGFYVHDRLLTPDSVIYSFGVGEEISFDLSLIDRHQCQVWAFDPTPRSADWVAKQVTPPKFNFANVGIGISDMTKPFYLPKNPSHVSGSFLQQENVSSCSTISVDMQSITSILKRLGHKFIDLLKLDIEGSEYEVIPNLLEKHVYPAQIVLEFHDRFFPDTPARSKHTVGILRCYGYQLFAISPSLQEASFIRSNMMHY